MTRRDSRGLTPIRIKRCNHGLGNDLQRSARDLARLTRRLTADRHDLAVDRVTGQDQAPAARPAPDRDLIAARRDARDAERKRTATVVERARHPPEEDVRRPRRSEEARIADPVRPRTIASVRTVSTALADEVHPHPPAVTGSLQQTADPDVERRQSETDVRRRRGGEDEQQRAGQKGSSNAHSC